MSPRPKPSGAERLCLFVDKHEGVVAYGNREALRALAAELLWIADSDPDEHFHCHVRMQLENEDARFGKPEKKNIWVLLSEPTVTHQPVPLTPMVNADGSSDAGFDLTFMHVPDSALEELGKHQRTGVKT